MKIVISPAKSLQHDLSFHTEETTVPSFLKETNQLVKKMRKLSVSQLKDLMHLSPALAALNYERYKNWESPEAPSDLNMPCVYAFTGEVYKGLDAASLSTGQIKYAQEHLRILSGLYGILKPLDLMYPYRLEMGTKWQITPETKNLYAFWGKKLAEYLNKEMKLEGEDTLVNLASTEYFKAIDKKALKATVITPVFKELKDGNYKVIMIFAKHARGAMARYIIENEITDRDQLKLFNTGGYQFDVRQSTENEWVFTR